VVCLLTTESDRDLVKQATVTSLMDAIQAFWRGGKGDDSPGAFTVPLPADFNTQLPDAMPLPHPPGLSRETKLEGSQKSLQLWSAVRSDCTSRGSGVSFANAPKTLDLRPRRESFSQDVRSSSGVSSVGSGSDDMKERPPSRRRSRNTVRKSRNSTRV
jgi:hypothetical protein